jgi:hypothetical protein
MVKSLAKKLLVFSLTLAATTMVSQVVYAVCNNHVSAMKTISDRMVPGDTSCIADEDRWDRHKRNLVDCITDNTPYKPIENNSAVRDARKKLGGLMKLEAPSCQSDSKRKTAQDCRVRIFGNSDCSQADVNFDGYPTTDPNRYIQVLISNIIPEVETVFDPTKSEQYNTLQELSAEMQRFIDNNEETGDPRAVAAVKAEKRRVDNQIARLETSESDRMLNAADTVIENAEEKFATAKEDNEYFIENYPSILAELEAAEEAVDRFFDVNQDLPRTVSTDPAFTENEEAAAAISDLNRTLNEPLYDQQKVDEAQAELDAALADLNSTASTIASLQRKLDRELTKPDAAQHEQNIADALNTLVNTLANRPPETTEAQAVYRDLQDILSANAGDYTAVAADISDQIRALSEPRSAVNRDLQSSAQNMSRAKSRKDLDAMQAATDEALRLLEMAQFSVDSYYAMKGMAVTSVDKDGNIITLGASRTASDTSQYYAVKQDDGSMGYMKIDEFGNAQYSIKETDGSSNYIGQDGDGNQYLYTTDEYGLTQYYILDAFGNLHHMQSEIKYSRPRIDTTVITLPEAEAAARAFLADNPELDARITYRLRRVVDYSESLTQEIRDNDRYASRYITLLMREIDYLEFYDKYSDVLDERYSSTIDSLTIDPETGEVGIGRVRTVAGDVGGELDASLGLSANALSDLLAVAEADVTIDGVTVTGGDRYSRIGRDNVGTVTTVSADKLAEILGGLTLDEYLAQQYVGIDADQFNVTQQVDEFNSLISRYTAVANESAVIKQSAESAAGYTSLLAAEMLAREYLAANAGADPTILARLESALNYSEGMTDTRREDSRYAQSRANSLLNTIHYTEVLVHNQQVPTEERIAARDNPVLSFTAVDGSTITIDRDTGTATVAGIGDLNIEGGIQDAGLVLTQLSTSFSGSVTDSKAATELEALVAETIALSQSGEKGYGLGVDSTGSTLVAVGGALGVISLSGTTPTAAELDEAYGAAVSSSYLNRTGELAIGYETITLENGTTVNQALTVEPSTTTTTTSTTTTIE